MVPKKSAVEYLLAKMIACYVMVAAVILVMFMLWSYYHYQETQHQVAETLQSVVISVMERAPQNMAQALDWVTLGAELSMSVDSPLTSFALMGDDGRVVFAWPHLPHVSNTGVQWLETFAIKNSSFTLVLAYPETPLHHIFNRNLFVLFAGLAFQLALLIVLLKVVINRGVRPAAADFCRELAQVCLQRPSPLQAHSYFEQFKEYRQILANINRLILALIKSREELAEIKQSIDTHVKAEMAALSERNKVLLERNQHLSIIANTDALTQVYNRTRFDSLFIEYVALARRRGTPLAILLVDLDDFKKVNDRFGHQIGDHVLTHAAQAIQEEIGDDGIVARWGGEEFAVLLPYFDLENAEKKAEKLRSIMANARFEEPSIRVTASIGVAQLSAFESGAQLLKRADDALYDAKGSGRNRVIIAFVEESHRQLEFNTLMEGEFIEVFDVDPEPTQDEPKVS